MGIFPIIMNVLQFWLIDSVVKASGIVALPSDSTRNSFDDPAHQPLFDTPSDDEDGASIDARPPHDIENPLPQRSQPATDHIPTVPQPAENKTATFSRLDTTAPRDVPAVHSYPPSIASSSTTRSASPPVGKPQRLPKQFKRRPPPPPLDLESPSHPAANLPAAIREAEKQDLFADDASKEWDHSWGDADGWANRVEESDWTEQRIGQKGDDRNDQSRQVLSVGA